MVTTDSLLEELNNLYLHLSFEPDCEWIECLFLNLLTLLSLTMSVSSILTMIISIKKHKNMPCHWSIRFSIGILLISAMVSVASFILLIYQQNGRHFDFADFECKVVVILIVFLFVLSPSIAIISSISYLRWKSLLISLKMDGPTVRWTETQRNTDLMNLHSVNQEQVVLNAHKSRYRLHLFSFLGQLTLFIAVQSKKYHQSGHQDRHFIADWNIENCTMVLTDNHQDFESLEWAESITKNEL